MFDLGAHSPLVKSIWECLHFQFVYLNNNLIWVFPFGKFFLIPVTSLTRPHGRLLLFRKFGLHFKYQIQQTACHLSA